MNYRLLGNSGLRVPEVALGTMTFGTDWGWGADADEARKIYATFRDAGGNFVDTASIYTNGSSESIVGKLVSSERDAIVHATKYSLSTGQNKHPNAAGNSRKTMLQSIETSLRRLKTDYIDLFWLHAWDFTTPVEEVLRGLDDLVEQGKVLYLGISDTPAWIVSQANAIAHIRGWSPFVATQIEYNLTSRTPERELIPMARALDLAVLAWSPLAMGILTGKYGRRNGQKPVRGRGEKMELHQFSDRAIEIGDAVVEVAGKLQLEPAEVAINWLRSKETIPLLGASKTSQMTSNLKALEWELPAEVVCQLDHVSAIDYGFPHEFLPTQRDIIFGGFYDQIINHRRLRSGETETGKEYQVDPKRIGN
jgi:aryl-alcohol dehydrogenase-like predicted oxidoreductase